ncbi:MAG: hypothetical protein ACRDNZ_22880, partial [Streptosporangiaceae bacterium]
LLIGSAAVLLAAATGLTFAVRRPPREQHAALAAGPRLWRDPAFLLGLGPVTGLGFLLGVVEIAAIAAVLADRHPSLVGIPSALVSGGSVVGGLLYGRHTWPGSVTRRACALTAGSAVLVAAAGAAAHAFIPMVALLALAGLCISPAFVCSYLIADLAAPWGGAEATSWVNGAFNVSLAGGYVVAGTLIDAWSPGWTMAAGALLSAGVVLASTRGRVRAGAERAPGRQAG